MKPTDPDLDSLVLAMKGLTFAGVACSAFALTRPGLTRAGGLVSATLAAGGVALMWLNAGLADGPYGLVADGTYAALAAGVLVLARLGHLQHAPAEGTPPASPAAVFETSPPGTAAAAAPPSLLQPRAR